MNKKTIYIIAAVLVVVIVATGAGILLLNNNTKSPSNNTAPINIANASSLQFNVNDTTQGTTTTYQFAGQNIGTANLTIRVDIPSCTGGSNYTYVLTENTGSAWYTINNGAWVTDNFTTAWPLWGNMWTGYVQKLDTWNSTATYSYTGSSGDSVVIFNIHVNPPLPSSEFKTS
jgi:hypothetical protein